MRSIDLQPGDRLRHSPSGTVVVLDRRKTPEESPRLPGWWVRGHGGLADFVIDDPDREWELFPPPAVDVDPAEHVEWACQAIYAQCDGYWPSEWERARIRIALESIGLVNVVRAHRRTEAEAQQLRTRNGALVEALTELTTAAACFSQRAFVAQFDAIQKARALLAEDS